MTVKLNQETAEAITRLSHNKDFELFIAWFDAVYNAMRDHAIQGVDENFSADVLRGRAQAFAIIRQEMANAPNLVGRIQKVR